MASRSSATATTCSTACSESPLLSIPLSDDEVQSVQASEGTEKETDEQELCEYRLFAHLVRP
jgi:hypothetical protein